MYEIDEKCRKCKNNGTAICNRCDMYYDEFEPIDRTPLTNYDRIISKTLEELAEWLEDRFPLPSNGLWADWLKQEAE